MRLFVGHAEATEGRAPTPEVTQKRLEDLAANRVAIERVTPELDGGRFPVKRIVGDVLTVEADIFVDGHDKLAAVIRYRPRRSAGVAAKCRCGSSTTTAGPAASR